MIDGGHLWCVRVAAYLNQYLALRLNAKADVVS